MTWFIISIPLIIVATAISTAPILYLSAGEHRRFHASPVPVATKGRETGGTASAVSTCAGPAEVELSNAWRLRR